MSDFNNGNPNESVNGHGNEQLQDALVRLMNRTGYSMVQENGQRKLGPPPLWSGPPPIKGSEIFIGKIPRDVYEDELFPLFEQIGPIYEMRLMMDFSGSNRGYAFVTYTGVDDAKKAIHQMNNYQIRPGKYLGVVKSVDNCRLFVGYIPKTKTKEEITEEISKVTEGVVDVILYNSPRDKAKNRGFAFVEYDSHRAAAVARRKLLPGRIMLWNQQIQIDWAEPEPEVDEETMATVRILYVRNLMEETTEEAIKNLFEGDRSRLVEKVKKMRDFAFVHFVTRTDAEDALNRLNGTDLDGSTIVVTWAKPIDRTNRFLNRRGGGGGRCNFNNGYNNNAPSRFPMPFNGGLESPAGIPFGMSQAGHIIAYQAPGNAGRGGGFGPRPTSFRGRGGRGAAGLRGGRGYYGGGLGSARHPEFRYFDLPPGYSFMQTNPMPLIRPAKTPYQILADICQKNSFGEPQFQVIPCVPSHGEGGPNVQLYQCKVIIPNWGSYTTTRQFRSSEDAKFYAASGVLEQMSALHWEEDSDCNSLSPRSVSYTASPKHSGSSAGECCSSPSRPFCSLFNNNCYIDGKTQQNTNGFVNTRNELPAFYDLTQSGTLYAMAAGGPPVGPTPSF